MHAWLIGRTGELGEHAPVAGGVGLDVVDEELVLLRRPRPFLQPLALAAGSPAHGAGRRTTTADHTKLRRVDGSMSIL